MKRVGSLDVDEDLSFQKAEWRTERVGWILIGLFILAAVAGFFGSGPVSRAKAETPDGLIQVEYSRFLRWNTPQFLRIRFVDPNRSRLTVSIPGSLLQTWKIDQVTPEPDSVVLHDDDVLYIFGGDGPGTVQFEYQFRRPGSTQARVGLSDDRAVEIRQFAFP